MQSYAPFEDMLRRNHSIDVPALATAYVQSFQGELLPEDHLLVGTDKPDPPALQLPVQAGSSSSGDGAASKDATMEHTSATVSLKTFKDLMDDLKTQIKDINELNDKV